MNQKKIRLLLVDDHKVVRMGLASLFRVVPAFDVVGFDQFTESVRQLGLYCPIERSCRSACARPFSPPA